MAIKQNKNICPPKWAVTFWPLYFKSASVPSIFVPQTAGKLKD